MESFFIYLFLFYLVRFSKLKCGFALFELVSGVHFEIMHCTIIATYFAGFAYLFRNLSFLLLGFALHKMCW